MADADLINKPITLGEMHLQFHLAVEPNIGMTMFMTMLDEDFLQKVGKALFDSVKDHPLYFVNSNFMFKDDYAAVCFWDSFMNIPFEKEAGFIKDVILKIIDIYETQIKLPNPQRKIYISINSATTDNLINFMYEVDNQIMNFGAELNH